MLYISVCVFVYASVVWLFSLINDDCHVLFITPSFKSLDSIRDIVRNETQTELNAS